MATLNSIASTLLAAAVAGVTNPPDRQYISPGKPPADCEQIVVYVESAGLKPTESFPTLSVAQRGKPVAGRRTAFGIDLTRCVPTAKSDNNKYTLPTVTELGAAATQLNNDVEALYKAILGANLTDCAGYAFLGVDVGPRLGAFQTITAHAIVGN